MHARREVTRALVGAGLALALGVSSVAPATAHTHSRGHHHGGGHLTGGPVVEGLTAPLLGLAVSDKGTVHVSQTFAGVITAVSPSGTPRDVFTAPPGFSVSGLDVRRNGSVIFTYAGEDAGGPVALVRKLKRNGKVSTLGDMGAYEAIENPDQKNSYGFQGLTQECIAEFPPADPEAPPEEQGPSGDPYLGQIDSNPYAVAQLPHGRGVVVADAGGNDLVRISPSGRMSTLAVLPPLPVEVTSDMQAAVGLPECTIGKSYNFEPVPTDVEVGRDGMLYVTSLPGGPEDASLGARGSVFRVNPWNGRAQKIATGFLGAVDLAIGRHGRIYVAEIFGGTVSKVQHGGAVKVADVPGAGAIEYAHGNLYVTSGGGFFTPTGSVLKIRP